MQCATTLLSILFFGLTASVSAQSYYANGTFETAGSGGNPQSWQPWFSPAPEGSATFRQNPGDAPQGVNYVRVSNTAAIQNFSWSFLHGWGASPEKGLEPNCTYRLTYKYRRSASGIMRSIGIGTGCFNCYSFEGNNSPDVFYNEAGPTDIGVVGAWTNFTNLHRTIQHAGYSETLWFGAIKSQVNLFATLDAGNYVDYDDILIELVERHTSGILQLYGVGSYGIANTNCTIVYTALDASFTPEQTVAKVTGVPSGLGIPGLGWYVDISMPSPAPASFSARVTLSYTDAEVLAAGLTESQLVLRRQSGNGPWEIIPSTVNTVQNTITMTGTTSQFSSWAITGASPSAAADWELFE